jgi:hypothetical protein
MKKVSLLILIIISFQELNAQLEAEGLTITGGKNFASFLFRNDANEKDEQMKYEMLNSFGVNASFISDRHVIRPELLFRQAGARSDFNGLPLSWRMNYAELNFAYFYSIFQKGIFDVRSGLGLSAAYMLNGEQFIGEQRFSIVEENAMNRFDLGFQLLANSKAQLSDSFYLTLEYRFGLGITQIENEPDNQRTRNIYHGALIGLGFNLN